MNKDIPTEKMGCIVVGGGIAGLSAALTWALYHDVKEEQEPVLLIEKEPKTGGYVTSYERQGYQFDTCQMIPDISEILDFFDVKIELKKFQGYYTRFFFVNPKTDKVTKIEVPSGYNNFKNKLMTDYPKNAKEIEHFLDYSRAMYKELFGLKMNPGFGDILKMIFTTPKIIKNASKTFQQYFDQFNITEPDAIEVFDAYAAFAALPSDRSAALMTVSAMNSLVPGAFRPKKGFIEFPLKIEEKFLEKGGKLLTNTKVKRILVKDGKVQGVRLENGQDIQSDYVITTIDPKVAMKEMVGLKVIRKLDKKYAEKVEAVKMSTSSLNIALGLDDKIDLAGLGLDCGYNVMSTGTGSFERLFDAYEKGEMAFSEKQFHFGVICPSLTTGGKPNITIRVVPMAMADWGTLRESDPKAYKARKEEIADFFIGLCEKYLIPDLSKHIVIKDISTPATYARYSGSPTGSIYDMSPYPDNFGRSRLKMKTPIKGLYQPRFVHGVFASLLSGIQANDMILNGKINNGNARLPKEFEE
ncbi:MAG: phytoene desaturase family protein [Candidatus Heimdallarchaeota archaeon]